MRRQGAPQRQRGAHLAPRTVDEEGGLCSTPLQKYMEGSIQPLYRGFDGLDVSFAGRITHELSERLDAAKEQAQETHQEAPVTWNGVRMLVAESGGRGGYAFRANTGSFGATWFFKKPNPRDPWGVRVSCNSFNLALRGLGGARAELYRTMELLGIVVGPEGESLGRVDYAVDFLAPTFVLEPEHFVMHSHATRADHIEEFEITVHGKSGRVTSVTVGKMPGRQIIVYDKRADVLAKHKVAWWEIWDSGRSKIGLPPLNRLTPSQSRVWRVEIRAGKDHLKDGWNIRTWRDLDLRLGDMVAASILSIRHTSPTADSNRSRWPNSELWNFVRQETEADLFEMRCWAKPDLVKQVEKDAHLQLLAGQMMGLLTTLAALSGIGIDGLEAFATRTGSMMAREVARAPSRFEAKLTAASLRYDLGVD